MIRIWTSTIIAFLLIELDLLVTSTGATKFEFLISNPKDPELFYNTMELICNEGYPVQQHKIKSQDGYILTVTRIPNGNRRQRVMTSGRQYTKLHRFVHPDYYNCINESVSERPTGPPVLIQHGLLAASDSWVLRGAEKDLAYLLADAGYDVWLSDARGNFYSRQHVFKSTSSKEFWDFSFYEMAYYDIPEIIDYILAKTKQKQLYYIGHSMGTTIFFTLGSTRPEYMSKIRLATLLAPVANVTMTLLRPPQGPITAFTIKSLEELWKRKGIYEFLPRVNWVPLVVNKFCNQKSILQDFCYDIFVSVDGHPYYNVIRKNFARIVAHFLSGTSAKTFMHFYQMLVAQRFQYYDFGEDENFRRYQQAIPPEFNLGTITAPVALIYSDSDMFTDAEQVEETAKLLPNVVFMKMVTQFLHTDFIIARNAKELVYDDVLDYLKKY